MAALEQVNVDGIEDPVLREALRQVALKRWWTGYLAAQVAHYHLARELREVRAIDGPGMLKRQVPMFEVYDAAHQYGGFEIWQDKTFLRQYDRDNPGCRPRCQGTRIQQGFRGATPMYRPWSASGNRVVAKRYTA